MPTYYSPLFGGSFALRTYGSGDYRQLFRFARRHPKVMELLDELIGVAPGQTALSQRKRVAANRTENGGKRTIELRTYINRATVAADVTALEAMLLTDSKIATPLNRAGKWTA